MGNEDEVKDVKSEIGEMLKSIGGMEDNSQDDNQDDNQDKDDAVDQDKDKDDSGDDNKDDSKDDKGSDDEDDKSDDDKDKDDKGDKDADDKDDEPDEKDKIILALRTKLAEKETVKEPEKKEEEEVKEEPLKFVDQDFVGELDIEEVLRDPKEFNKLLNTIYQKAVTDTRQILGEGVLRSIPDIVKTNITVMTNLKKASDKFYVDNKDLVPFKKVVATVFEELASENPGKKYDEILDEVGTEVRKRLDLKKEAVKKDVDDKDDPPKLHRKKGKAGGPEDEKPNTSSLQNDISKMNTTLGR